MTQQGAAAKTAEKTERVQLLMSPDELKGVDDARFDLRIGTRSETIRRLLRKGLAAERENRE
jgi:metal-responsive CopG/Arc/MetJ family transcriptional regulator